MKQKNKKSSHGKKSTKDAKLATFTRKRENFKKIFGVERATLIEHMDKWAADVAKQRPAYPTKLTTVGMYRDNIPISLADPLDTNITRQINCKVRISVSLEAMLRGIHVSRMCNTLADVASTETYRDLLQFTTALADQVAKSQEAASCRVEAEGAYTFIELVDGWNASKHKRSIEAIPLLAETSFSEERRQIKKVGFRISHMTACPCVQGALKTLLRLKKAESDLSFFTHSQRCVTEVLLHDVKEFFDLAKALTLIDECTTRTQNTLPREQELALVHESHTKPSFLEDVVRCCAMEFHNTFVPILNSSGIVKVSSISQESIHDFDLHAEAQYPINTKKSE